MSAIMERIAAALADRYRIERELGAGGMATVYLAHDLKHDRKVALKVLKPELAAVLGAERFVVEIKTTASLSHPHILPLFDSGNADGFLFYVMPFIEGETLRGKLNRETQFGIDEAVRIASEVADALDYAHRHGVIHRDIKPENILLHDGRPMVADFGIALAVSAAAGGRMTETGLSLGTPHYMSPEQATAAKEITARSDVYSLGSVLYEMLTGSPPHVGATAQQIIMKIVTEEAAPVTKARKAVPPHVADAVARSLEKLPADRFESAKAFAEALASTTFSYSRAAGGTAGSGPSRGATAGAGGWDRRSRLLAGGVAVLALVSLWLAFGRGATEDGGVPAPVVAFRMIDSVPGGLEPALAIDGTIAFVRDGAIRVRHAGEFTEVALPGTAAADPSAAPVFSPDGGHFAYTEVTGSGSSSIFVVRRMATRGGTPSTLWTGVAGVYTRALSWSEDGWIYVVRSIGASNRYSLLRLKDTGGVEEEVVSLPLTFVQDARLLPGSRGLALCLVSVVNGAARVVTLDLANGDTASVATDACSPRWSPTGHLLVSTLDGAINAIPFDLRRLRTTGPPTRVLDDVATSAAVARYELSATGTLVFAAGPPTNLGSGASFLLGFVDFAGRREPIPLPATDHPDAGLSPDGRQLAYTRGDQIWLYDLDLGTHRQLTTAGTGHHNPVWSPDGKRIAYRSLRDEGKEGDIYVQSPTGDSAAVHLGGSPAGDNPTQWLADGTILAHTDGAIRDIVTVKADQPGTATPALRADWVERYARVSPDGKWLAYVSEEGGLARVTVRSWPALGKKSVISEGSLPALDPPQWSLDSRTLYYRQRQRLMAASLSGGDSLRVSMHRVVVDSLRISALRDLHPDGRRFLVFLPGAQADTASARRPRQLLVVTNWLTALRARLQGGAAP